VCRIEVLADPGCEFQDHILRGGRAKTAPADQGHVVVLVRSGGLEQVGVFVQEVRVGEMLKQDVVFEGDGGRVPVRFVRDFSSAVDAGELPEVGRELSVEQILLGRWVLKVRGEMQSLLVQTRSLVQDRSISDDLAIVQAKPQ